MRQGHHPNIRAIKIAGKNINTYEAGMYFIKRTGYTYRIGNRRETTGGTAQNPFKL